MKVLAIDPGSTSTKIGVFYDGELVRRVIEHPRSELQRFPRVFDQLPYRLQHIDRSLEDAGFSGWRFDAVIGRGGLIRPVDGGTYVVNEIMLRDLEAGVSGEHAANLGAPLARTMAERFGVAALVVDPPVLDEMWPLARLSGLAEVERRSMFHALNQKAAARSVARELGRPYESLNLIVAHLGGGITVGAHRKGRVVDVNNGLHGDGPYSPERTGGLPLEGVLRLLSQGAYQIETLREVIARKGGLLSYLGTVDLREAQARAAHGDLRARLVIDGMIYQIAKEIGALAAALDGEVDGIVVTGGLALSPELVEALSRKVRFIAPVHLRPGEHEIEALTEAALRVLNGADSPRRYLEEEDEDRT